MAQIGGNLSVGGGGIASIPTWRLLMASALSNLGRPGTGLNPIQLIIAQQRAQEEQKNRQNVIQLAQMGIYSQDGATATNPLLGRTSPQMANSPQAEIARMAESNPLIAEALAQRNLQSIIGGGGYTGTLRPGETAFQNGRPVASIPAQTDAAKISGKFQEFLDAYGGNVTRARAAMLADINKQATQSAPDFKILNDGTNNLSFDLKDPKQAAQYQQAINSGKYQEGAVKRPSAMDANAAAAGITDAFTNLDRLADQARKIRDNKNLGAVAGTIDSLTPTFLQSSADVEADFESLKSQVAFGVLQAMREASKTGGALGHVTERELSLLENNLAALSLRQSPEKLRKSLQQIIDYTNQIKRNLANSYKAQYGRDFSAVQASQKALRQKYGLE